MLRELNYLAPENVGFLPNKVVTSPDCVIARKTTMKSKPKRACVCVKQCPWGQQQN